VKIKLYIVGKLLFVVYLWRSRILLTVLSSVADSGCERWSSL